MDFLRTSFEEQLAFSVDTDGSVWIAETKLDPVTILKSDQVAYEDAYLRWRGETWLPEQQEKLNEILENHVNRDRFIDLCNALKSGFVIPFVGSGMSVPAGLSTWKDFLRSIRRHSTMDEAELEGFLNRCEFEEAVEILMGQMPPPLFDERVEHDLRINSPDTICGAIRFLPKLFEKIVITTNLDDVIEKLYDFQKVPFSNILAGTSIKDYRRIRPTSEKILMKIHGDCRHRDGRVLSKTEYDTAYAPGAEIREEFTMAFRTQVLLFMGCSLGPDRIVTIIEEASRADHGIAKHYAFLEDPGDEATRLAREHFLVARGIFPIWYIGDHDECIQALLVGMLVSLDRL